MGKMPKVTVWVDGAWIKIRAPYDKGRTPACIQDLKDNIPVGSRKWDPDEKVWKVDPAHDAVLMEILGRWYDEVCVLELNKPAPAPMQQGEDPYGKMLRLCPDSVMPKVYRTIAAALHPDTGGDQAKMAELNVIWEQIKTERGLT